MACWLAPLVQCLWVVQQYWPVQKMHGLISAWHHTQPIQYMYTVLWHHWHVAENYASYMYLRKEKIVNSSVGVVHPSSTEWFARFFTLNNCPLGYSLRMFVMSSYNGGLLWPNLSPLNNGLDILVYWQQDWDTKETFSLGTCSPQWFTQIEREIYDQIKG
jgi:hypothetical protein